MTAPGGDPQLLAEVTVASTTAEMAAAEETLTAAALRAIADYLGLAREAVLAAGGIPDLTAWPAEAQWMELVADYLAAAEREVYIAAYTRMMPEGTLIDPAPYVERFIATVSDRLQIWPAGAFEEIRLELADGIAAGETIDQLRDRIGASLEIDAPSREIRDRLAALTERIAAAEDPAQARELRAQRAAAYRDLDEADRAWHWKARRIARTETTMAVNGGLHDATEARIAATGETGVRKQWLATTDDRVRASHAEANGQVQFWGDPFLVGGHPMQHPGSPGAPASEVCNCRCTMLVLPGGTDPFPLEPIGEAAPGNLAAATSPEAAMTTPVPGTAPAGEAALPDGWRGPLVPLDVPSCDDRVIGAPADGELQTRPLPRPLKAQYASAEGHDGASVVGLIERAWIETDAAELAAYGCPPGVQMLFGEGPLDLGDPASAEWARRLGEGYAGWVSVDLDVPTVTEMVWDDNTGTLLDAAELAAPGPEGGGTLEDLISGLFEPADLPEGQRPVMYVNPWRLMSATLVADQAFPEAQVRPVYGYTPATTDPAALAAAAAPEDHMTVKTAARTLVAAPPPPPQPKAAPPAPGKPDAGPPLPAVGDRVIVENPDAGGPGEVTAVDTQQSPPQITVNLDAGGPVTVPADQVKPDPNAAGKTAPPAKKAPPALAARNAVTAAAPLRPPSGWFADPELAAPTPLTITAAGRVTGHLAVWDTCHTGYENMCVTPPRSATSYALFHNGEVECADGTLIACGKITLGGGHADPAAGLRAAVEHYDNTCTAAAIVRVYEDAHGIAVAGALCPDADETIVAALRRSPLSGDWRRYGGNLELVAALAVNTPGFPVRRPSLAAAANPEGRQNSLVAAGVLPPAPTALSAGIADAVSAALDARDRRTARAAAARARITAPAPPPYARTRAVLAAARFAGGTASAAAARTAAAAGYAAAGGR